MANAAITTTDNPFDPFTDFDNWNNYDTSKGYHSASILARLANIHSGMSPDDMEKAVEEAVDKMVKYNFTGNYKKVTR